MLLLPGDKVLFLRPPQRVRSPTFEACRLAEFVLEQVSKPGLPDRIRLYRRLADGGNVVLVLACGNVRTTRDTLDGDFIVVFKRKHEVMAPERRRSQRESVDAQPSGVWLSPSRRLPAQVVDRTPEGIGVCVFAECQVDRGFQIRVEDGAETRAATVVSIEQTEDGVRLGLMWTIEATEVATDKLQLSQGDVRIELTRQQFETVEKYVKSCLANLNTDPPATLQVG